MEIVYRNKIVYALKIIFIVSILYYLFTKFGTDTVANISRDEISFFPLITALFFAVLHTYGVFFAWHTLLRSINIYVPYRTSFDIYIYSLMARYLPGGVWHIGGRLISLAKLGYKFESISFSLMLEQLISLSVCVLLAIGFYLYQLDDMDSVFPESFRGEWWFFLPLVIALFIVPYAAKIYNKLLILFKREESRHVNMHGRDLLSVYLYHVFTIIVFSLVYYCSLLVFVDIGSLPVSKVIAVVLFATVVGYLVPFLPGGLGAREGVIVVLLSGDIDGTVLYWSAIVARLLLIGSELFLLSFTLMPHKGNKNNAS